MLKGLIYRLILFLVLLVGATVACVLFWKGEQYVPSMIALGAAVVFVVKIVQIYYYNVRKITFMFNSIENNDYTFRFSEYSNSLSDDLFNMSLNRIKELLVKAKTEAMEREKYYELILSSVITGVVAINEKGNIFQTNDRVLKLLGMEVLTHINQLGRVDESFPALFASLKSGDSCTVSYHNERGTTNLSLQVSEVTIRGNKLKVIAINDIDRELDEKELESWVRLTRVLTHEIMNAVTPVTSLSDTLLTMHGNKDDDFGRGLEAIHTTSKGLISFVESYRRFTRIAAPEMTLFYVQRFLEQLVVLVENETTAKGIRILIRVEEEDLMLNADENQIAQVVLNLLKNAVAAIGDRDGGVIEITAGVGENESVVIEVKNNGAPIPPDVAEHIFVPFFTTKENGSGIGLSISRQIMRQHNGSIKLKYSMEGETAFVLVFR